MKPFEDFQKHAMREAMNRVCSWKHEHPDEYSRFSLDMMKVERNDFSSLERIFKMAVSFVPTHVLIECRKLLAPNSEEVLSDDERTIAASRVVDELMGLKGYLRFGVYAETVGDKDAPDQAEQFLIREFSLSDEDLSEEDDEHIYVPYVTAQEFRESFPSFIQMAIFTFGKGHSADERAVAASRVVDELMGLKGYLRFGVYTETVGEKDATGPSEQFLIREFSLADEDQSEEDDEHIYVPYVTAQEFWETLPSFVQMAVFTFGKGHSADELAALSKRIMLSAIQAMPEMFVKLRDQIHAGSNPLLMCTLYYICYDHGLPRSAMALSKVSLGAKQLSYIRESVKAVVEKLMETSVTNAPGKKSRENDDM